MRMNLSRSGVTLALLAISLQVLICAWGGRICFSVSSLPVFSDCETECCDVDEDAEDRGALFSMPVTGVPIAPFEPGCCLEPVLEFLSQYTGQVKLQTPTNGPTAVVTMAARYHLSSQASISCSPARRLGLTPPALPIVQSTILLL